MAKRGERGGANLYSADKPTLSAHFFLSRLSDPALARGREGRRGGGGSSLVRRSGYGLLLGWG